MPIVQQGLGSPPTLFCRFHFRPAVAVEPGAIQVIAVMGFESEGI